jgi:hypothetical protein
VKDTSDRIDKKFRNMLLDHSGEERLKMGCSMHATARALVIASIPRKDVVTVKRELFLRFYGAEFESKRCKRIVRALQEAANSYGKSENFKSDAVREDKETYRRKAQSRAKGSRR